MINSTFKRSFLWPQVIENSEAPGTYEDEDEGDEELDSEGLSDREVFIDRGHAETGSTANLFGSEKLKKREKEKNRYSEHCCSSSKVS